MYTITETLTTETGEVIASGESYAIDEESCIEKVRKIHDRNDAIGLVNGKTYRVEYVEPTGLHVVSLLKGRA